MDNEHAYDSCFDLERGEISERCGGRGAKTGWLKCPLCPPSSQKRFALGRGFASHLRSIHAPNLEGCTYEERRNWQIRAAEVVKLAEEEYVASGPGRTRDGRIASEYVDSLPEGLVAARNGDVAKLQALLENGWDPLKQVDRNGSTAEHWAAGSGHLRCLELLLQTIEDGSTVRTTAEDRTRRGRRDGKNSLHWAARNGRLRCIEFLLSKSYDVDAPSADGTTPLHLACYGSHLESCRFLASKGSDATKKNAWGCDATHWSCMSTSTPSNAVKVCDWLRREVGCAFHLPQREGHTPAHKAAQRGNRHVLEWMVSSDCGMSDSELHACFQKDKSGRTPSAIARCFGFSSLAAWIQTHETRFHTTMH